MGAWPRFVCATCRRSVASVYRDAVHVSARDASTGRRHQYAYLRWHKGADGQRCPTDTVQLAELVPRAAGTAVPA